MPLECLLAIPHGGQVVLTILRKQKVDESIGLLLLMDREGIECTRRCTTCQSSSRARGTPLSKQPGTSRHCRAQIRASTMKTPLHSRSSRLRGCLHAQKLLRQTNADAAVLDVSACSSCAPEQFRSMPAHLLLPGQVKETAASVMQLKK